MPCDMVVTTQTHFLPESTDRDLLDKALSTLGVQAWEYNFDSKTGRLVLPRRVDVNQVKRQYAKEVVNRTAQKKGWRISWKQNDQGLDEATVIKRRY